MDIAKLRIKIGVHEFEAEGPSDQVSRQFEVWKALITSAFPAEQLSPKAIQNTALMPGTAALGISGGDPAVSSVDASALAPIFTQDEKRDLVILRVLPTGEDRHRAAVLLTLLGYLRLKRMDEVGVTKLKASLQSSGSAPDRVDRAATPSVVDGLLMKSGSGKGGKYRLTNKGIVKTEELVNGLLQQLT
jgi:hypothetical protein